MGRLRVQLAESAESLADARDEIAGLGASEGGDAAFAPRSSLLLHGVIARAFVRRLKSEVPIQTFSRRDEPQARRPRARGIAFS